MANVFYMLHKLIRQRSKGNSKSNNPKHPEATDIIKEQIFEMGNEMIADLRDLDNRFAELSKALEENSGEHLT